MDYGDLRGRVFAHKQPEAAEQLFIESARHADIEAKIYAFFVINRGPRYSKEDDEQIREAFTQFFGENPSNDEMLAAQEAYLGLIKKKLIWADDRSCGITKRPIQNMGQNKLHQFVKDFLNGQIFTSAQIPEFDNSILHLIFMPLAFGAINPEHTDLATLGIFWEYNNEASPRSINEYPIFFSCRIMHIEDWTRARAAIMREQKHMENIQV